MLQKVFRFLFQLFVYSYILLKEFIPIWLLLFFYIRAGQDGTCRKPAENKRLDKTAKGLTNATVDEGREASSSAGEEGIAPYTPIETALDSFIPCASIETPSDKSQEVEDVKDDFLVNTPLHNTDINLNHTLKLGAIFRDVDHFKLVLQENAIRNNYVYTPIECKKVTYAARCKDSSCKWRIRASKCKDVVKIKSYVSEHTCPALEKFQNHPLATASWVAHACRGNFFGGDITPAHIVSYIEEHWNVKISYKRAHMAKDILTENIRKSLEESYSLLPAYSSELERANPGSILLVARCCDVNHEGDQSFLRAFWTFGAVRRSFIQTMRRLIIVDDIDLIGKYPGKLLVASGVDGNGGGLPVAYAAVEDESCETWTWFFYLLQKHILMPYGEELGGVTMITKRDENLTEAMYEVLPNVKHGYCIEHLCATLHDEHKDVIVEELFWKAAKASRVCEYVRLMEGIKSQNGLAYKSILEIPKEKWANAYFRGNRYDVLLTNKCALVNSFLKDATALPIYSLIERTRKKTAELFCKRGKEGKLWTTPLTQYAEEHISKARETGQQYLVSQASLGDFQVNSSLYQDHVRLRDGACSCGLFQLMGLPCDHAMAAIDFERYDPYSFCQKGYLAKLYLETYEEVICPTLERSQWQNREHPVPVILPPKIRRRVGRPKSINADIKTPIDKPRVCGACGEVGHNKRACKNALDNDSPIAVLEPDLNW